MALKILSKTIPESKYIRKAITLRDMDLPQEVLLTKRSLLRWLALSIGVLSEKESRNTVVPVLDALLFFQVKEKKDPTLLEIKEYLDKEEWGMRGKESEKKIPLKAIRYHLGKLREIGLVELNERKYSFMKNPQNPEIKESAKYVFENQVKESIERINKAFSQLVDMYL